MYIYVYYIYVYTLSFLDMCAYVHMYIYIHVSIDFDDTRVNFAAACDNSRISWHIWATRNVKDVRPQRTARMGAGSFIAMALCPY